MCLYQMGTVTPESVRMMNEFLDCITVDFKGNGERNFNGRYAGIPDPQPIYETIKEIRDTTSIHIEITDLIVPRVGDDLDEAKKLAKFVHDELGPQTPIHFLRFHPDYKMMEFPPTPIETLEKHYEVAKKAGLQYVYLGNVLAINRSILIVLHATVWQSRDLGIRYRHGIWTKIIAA